MDNYKKIRIAGRGAYGTAFLARRLSDGKEVILKQIPVEQMSVMDRQSALNEIKVLSMLHHPNVIEYFENFLQDKAMMIVMEYAAGGTLFEFIKEKAKLGTFLEEEEVAFLFAQIILPMYYVHQNQVLHRDLKSENIFLTRTQDHIKIGDFGISKILSSKSKAFTVVGTPCYISPELCEGKPYNTKSDVWALGCILYELCVLKRAFDAPNLPALIMRIIRGVTTPIPNIYSEGVKQLLNAMLEVDPEKRPSVAEIMAHHWLAPHLYRVHTSVGGIPCNSKLQRSLSVTLPDSVDLPDPMQPKFGARRRSPSPFKTKEPKTEVLFFQAGLHPVPVLPKDPRSDISDIAVSSTHTVGVESSGAVLLWQKSLGEEKSSTNNLIGNPVHLEGMVGINIVQVSCGNGFICFLTDRGIVLSKGQGETGCLGHGDWRNVNTPKIIEELLGCDVVQVEASEDHVAIVTSDYEAYYWGKIGRKKLNVPTYIEMDGEIEKVICAPQATILHCTDGRVFVSGENRNNRLLLNEENSVTSSCDNFNPVAGSCGAVNSISVAVDHSLVLTESGDLWSSRSTSPGALEKLEIPNKSTKIISILASTQMDLFVLVDGSVYFWTPGQWKTMEKLSSGISKQIKSAKMISQWNKYFILAEFD